MTDVLAQNWYDENLNRAYPLLDTAGRLSTDQAFLLPNDLLVDALIRAPSTMSLTKFHILGISGFGTGLVIHLGYDGTLVGNCCITAPTQYGVYGITPAHGYPLVSGHFTIGTPAAVEQCSGVRYSFALDQTRLIPTCISDATAGVTSLTLVDPLGNETVLTGDVTLTAGDNVSLTIDGQTLRFQLDSGVLLDDPCPCTDQDGNVLPAVKTINGKAPDVLGNVEIIPAGQCLSITPGTNSLVFKDTCATPCCGEPEVQQLAEAARINSQHVATLANRTAENEASIRSLAAVTGAPT